VKKSFFTKSHSFSGSIPESKQGTAATSTPPTIAEVSKEAESVPISTPPEIETPAPAAPEAAAVTSTADATPSETPSVPAAETAQPVSESVTPAAEAPKEAPKDAVEEKAVVKEDKPKSKFFQKIVKRLLPKNSSHSTPQSAAPAPTPVVAASA
jgi:hypothetical protein